jgi:hypothetical protein
MAVMFSPSSYYSDKNLKGHLCAGKRVLLQQARIDAVQRMALLDRREIYMSE